MPQARGRTGVATDEQRCAPGCSAAECNRTSGRDTKAVTNSTQCMDSSFAQARPRVIKLASSEAEPLAGLTRSLARALV